MASRNLLRRSARLAAAVGSKRSAVCAVSTSVAGRQCFQAAPAAAQIRLLTTQSTASSEETTRPESSIDPEQRILEKAMNHVAVHGCVAFRPPNSLYKLRYPQI